LNLALCASSCCCARSTWPGPGGGKEALQVAGFAFVNFTGAVCLTPSCCLPHALRQVHSRPTHILRSFALPADGRFSMHAARAAHMAIVQPTPGVQTSVGKLPPTIFTRLATLSKKPSTRTMSEAAGRAVTMDHFHRGRYADEVEATKGLPHMTEHQRSRSILSRTRDIWYHPTDPWSEASRTPTSCVASTAYKQRRVGTPLFPAAQPHQSNIAQVLGLPQLREERSNV